LGAAGALEIAFCWMVLGAERDGEFSLPPHRWDGVRDPELSPIRLAGHGESVRARGRKLVASNSFGFGGNNCIVVLERMDS
jgi:3-oxoacyl-[acyl-carrier-protein] synthase-1